MFFMKREDCLYGAMIRMLPYFWLIIKGRKKCKTEQKTKPKISYKKQTYVGILT